MSSDYDVIVAGAGMAGALAAIAAAKGGAKTVLLDRNDQQEAGKKTNWGWVCGDACAKAHVDFIEKEVGIKLSSPEIDHKVDGVYVLSPDMKNKFLFDGEGYTLDRPKYARKMVQEAVKRGVDYKQRHEVEGPLLDGDKLTGVFGKDDKTQHFELHAKIVIDCLGMASTLRRRLPPNAFIEKDVSTDDIESTGRYIARFDHVKEDLNYYDSKNAIIHLNQQLAPGGYGWVFPKSDGRINIGIGVEKKSLDLRNKKLGKSDTLHKLIDEYVAWNPALKNMRIDETDHNGKGYWSVAVRRQFDSLVYNNYLGAGDTMTMPNPISAGGIGPAMVAGILAGKTAAEAVAANDVSMDFLWKYNQRFNDAYGNKTAGLEVFRIFLQSLNNEQINYGMQHFLTKEETTAMAYGLVPEISLASTFNKVLSGLGNIGAFKNLLYAHGKMKRLIELYKKYPKSVNEFKAWKETVAREITEAKARFPPNPI